MILFGESHLRRVLNEYLEHLNEVPYCLIRSCVCFEETYISRPLCCALPATSSDTIEGLTRGRLVEVFTFEDPGSFGEGGHRLDLTAFHRSTKRDWTYTDVSRRLREVHPSFSLLSLGRVLGDAALAA